MRCANCRAVIEYNENDNGDIKCEFGFYKDFECLVELCERCYNSDTIQRNCYIDQCRDCFIKSQENKLDLYFGDTAPGSYAATCDSVQKLYAKPNIQNMDICENLLHGTKFGLKTFIERILKEKAKHVKVFHDLMFEHCLNEGSAIFWVPITTTGTFFESGLFPRITDSIELSNYLENYFQVNENTKVKTIDLKNLEKPPELVGKEEWLLGTFAIQEQTVNNNINGVPVYKAVLSNCKILHYFVIKRELFPNVNLNDLLRRAKVLLDKIKNPPKPEDDEFIEPITLYLESIERQDACG